MSGIFRCPGRRARRLAATALVLGAAGPSAVGLACAAPHAAGSSPLPTAGPGSTVAPSQALVLGTSGAPPHDTTITFPAGRHRTIVVHHAPPDNVAFATLEFPPSVFIADTGRDVTVRLHAPAGVYRLDVETSSPIGRGATVTFHYARYFSAPPEARRTYGSDVAFERALTVARLKPDSMLVLLESARPAPDQLQALLLSAGTYVVAAGR